MLFYIYASEILKVFTDLTFYLKKRFSAINGSDTLIKHKKSSVKMQLCTSGEVVSKY